MNVDWGIGIEHETHILKKDEPRFSITGGELRDSIKLDKDTIGVRPYINDMIENDKIYKYYYPEIVEGLGPLGILNNSDNILTCLKDPEIYRYISQYRDLYVRDQNKNDSVIYLDIIKNITADTTLSINVPEFKNEYYKNLKIKDSVMEIKLQQNIVKRSIKILTGSDVYYPKIGSIFPLFSKDDDGFILDYTGSYHLNLSLPYDRLLLRKEEKKYLREKDSLRKLLSNYANTSRISDDLYFSEFYKIFLEKYGYILRKPQSRKHLEKIQSTTQIITDLYSNKFSSLYPRFIIRANTIKFIIDSDTRLRILDKKISAPPDEYIIYQTREDMTNIPEKINIKQYPVYQFLVPIFEFIIKAKKSNRYPIFTHLIIENNRLFLINEYISGIKFNDIPSYKKSILMTLPPRWELNMINFLRDYYIPRNKTNILKKTYDPDDLYNLNSQFNLHYLYQKGGYHYLHKIWAISIQFILPILLACLSSCDPFSIGDDNKLTELSLRLFIAGSSFINLEDIINFDIPNSREIDPNQSKTSDILSYLQYKTPYSFSTYHNGSDFRRDSNRPFNFGFELRVFDNFDINHVDVILEFLFLLADHIKTTKISKKGFTINPFNNRIVNIEIEKIVSQGWNSLISKSYVNLIRETLKLDIKWTYNLNAYDMCNTIYTTLQQKYTSGGQGIGPFTKYLITREKGYRLIPNINLLSWNIAFKNLVWDPESYLYRRINFIIRKSRSKKEFLNNLVKYLSRKYRFDVEDIIYALNYVKFIPNLNRLLK